MSSPAEVHIKDKGLWRDLTAYWFLGLCNNYGYVVMLTAAYDIIFEYRNEDHTATNSTHASNNSTKRSCNPMSTGAVLLADILPSFCVKFMAPFFPFWINARIGTAIGLTVFSFITVGIASKEWMAFFGIILTSASCGLGETSFLAYSSSFNKNVISTWSSGTGGAGIIGSASYTFFVWLDFTPQQTMFILLYVPTLEAIAFWLLLRHPEKSIVRTEEAELVEQEETTIKEKVKYALTKLMNFLMPLSLVYFAEYFINMGLFELVYFENIFIDRPTQYRWLSTDYQIGVFISRSSVNLIQFTFIWPVAILQFVNMLYFIIEAIFFITPSFWLIMVLVFWEGLLGGGAYVNTFYHMTKAIPPERRQFAIGIVANADSYGIITAGFLAIPVHNAICRTEVRKR